MTLRDYLRYRKLAFALKEVRDSDRNFLDIAVDYGFSSHEAFTRAFRAAYGIAPGEYRKKPVPVVLRTKLTPFDRYFFGLGEIGMVKSTEGVKTYCVTIPTHKFLHIRNYESVGYWDFWEKQSRIPGQDCETICGLLDSIKGIQQRQRPAYGILKRPERQSLQLGISSGGMLWGAPSGGLQRRGAAADDSDGCAGGRIHCV